MSALDWIGNVTSNVAAVAIGVIAASVIAWWRARRAAAQWTLEQVQGEDWTLTRDSHLMAFALHVYEEGTGTQAPRVHIDDAFAYRGDVRPGEVVRVTGITPGAEVRLDWVERDARLAARVVIRGGVTRVVFRRSDARPFRG